MMFLVRIHQNYCNSVIPAATVATKAAIATKASITLTFSHSIFNHRFHHLFPAISNSIISYSGCDRIDLHYYTMTNNNYDLF